MRFYTYQVRVQEVMYSCLCLTASATYYRQSSSEQSSMLKRINPVRIRPFLTGKYLSFQLFLHYRLVERSWIRENMSRFLLINHLATIYLIFFPEKKKSLNRRMAISIPPLGP